LPAPRRVDTCEDCGGPIYEGQLKTLDCSICPSCIDYVMSTEEIIAEMDLEIEIEKCKNAKQKDAQIL